MNKLITRIKAVRGNLVLALGLVLGFCLFALPTTGAAADITLSYANWAPAKTFPGVQLDRYKSEVEKRTKGAVKINAYHGGTLLGPKNMFEGVVSGLADIGAFPPGYHADRFPMMELFGAQLGWVNATGASAALFDLCEKFRPASLKEVKILAAFCITPAHIMSFDPVKSLDDLKGLEIRGSGMIVKVLELLGAKPIGMPMSEVPEALKKGVVRGLVTSVEVMKDFNFAEYCKYITKCYLPVAPWVAIMNMKKWNALPDNVKKTLDDMSREHSLWTGQYNDQHEAEAIEWSKEKHGVKVITLGKEDLQKWHKLLEPIISKYMEKPEGQVSGKEMWEEMVKLQEKYSKLYPGK